MDIALATAAASPALLGDVKTVRAERADASSLSV
jgi:hypothetical protein